MRIFRSWIVLVLFLALSFLSGQSARAELIASSKAASSVYLVPLRNGLSALTLVWQIDDPSKQRATAMIAGLSSVLSGGTASRSAFEIKEFLDLKGINQQVTSNGRTLYLTVSAPKDVFPEALVHLENVLLEATYSTDWYARQVKKLEPVLSTKTGRPDHVLSEVLDFLAYQPQEDAVASGHGFRFGQPSQSILRSGDTEIEKRVAKLIGKLPKAETTFAGAIEKWVEGLTGGNAPGFALPSGTIHFTDAESTEMLILFVKANSFENEDQQAGANLLVDYIGAKQGSEMFRIIRQEMRAAYDPRSHFVITGKKQALIAMSATTETARWPEVYARIAEIYENTRGGKVDFAGLAIQHDLMKRRYIHSFLSDPVWAAKHYLNEYPEGIVGSFNFPLFDAIDALTLLGLVERPQDYLPPLDQFLVILIGGGDAPTGALRANGYCAQPKNAPLGHCLRELSAMQN